MTAQTHAATSFAITIATSIAFAASDEHTTNMNNKLLLPLLRFTTKQRDRGYMHTRIKHARTQPQLDSWQLELGKQASKTKLLSANAGNNTVRMLQTAESP